jgi:hypothetical protein
MDDGIKFVCLPVMQEVIGGGVGAARFPPARGRWFESRPERDLIFTAQVVRTFQKWKQPILFLFSETERSRGMERSVAS